MDFIATCGSNKSIFWPSSRKKKLILLVWLLPSLCTEIKLLTRKINFFFPSCTIYYFFISYKILTYCSKTNDPISNTMCISNTHPAKKNRVVHSWYKWRLDQLVMLKKYPSVKILTTSRWNLTEKTWVL